MRDKNKIMMIKKIGFGVFTLYFSFAIFANVLAITGPTSGAGVGTGALSVDSSGNLSVGGSAASSIKLQIKAATSDSSTFGLKIIDSGSNVLLSVRSDGVVTISSTTNVAASGIKFSDNSVLTSANGLGGGVTSTPAGYVTPGYFNSVAGTGGNYSFPASLSVATSTAPSGGVLFVNGNVGIGTSAPSAALDIAYPSGQHASAVLRTADSIGNAVWTYKNGAIYNFFTGLKGSNGSFFIDTSAANSSGHSLTILQSGMVGISTTTPGSPLTVAGTIYSSTGGFKFPDGTTQTTAVTAGTNYWTLSGSNLYPTSTSYNLGIGTTTPQSNLHVYGDTQLGMGPWPSNLAHTGSRVLISATDEPARLIMTDMQASASGATILLGARMAAGSDAVTWADIDMVKEGSGAGNYANALAFSTQMAAGTLPIERMRLNNAGNLGIGTSTPTYPLTVVGTIHSTTGGFKFPDGTTQTTAAGASTWTRSAPYLYPSTITDDVGVGTASPGVAFEVSGADINNTIGAGVNAAAKIVNTNTGAAGRVAELQFGQSDTLKGAAIAGILKDGSNNSRYDLAFATRKVSTDANLTTNLYIDGATGNIGIGTTTPGGGLSFSLTGSPVWTTSGYRKNIAMADAGAIEFGQGNTTKYGMASYNNNFYLWDTPDENGTQAITAFRMLISGGNVGIGTFSSTNPNAPLHVQGAAGGSTGLARFSTSDFVNGSVGSGILMLTGANSGNTYTSINAFTAGFSQWGNLILNFGGGAVGIGTTAPGAALEVKYMAANSSVSTPGLIVNNPSGGTQSGLALSNNGAIGGFMRADSAGNMVVNGVSTGALYLNWDNGTGGIVFGNGAQGSLGGVSSAGLITGAGGLSANSQKVVNVATPTLSTDAATKGYVDSLTSGWNKQTASCGTANCTATATCTAGTYVVQAVSTYKSSGCVTSVSNWPNSGCWGQTSCAQSDLFSCATPGVTVTILCGK